MKKLILSFIAFLTLISFAGQAQNTHDVDSRVYLHYSQTQVNEMLSNAPLKIKMLNVYYRSSFVLIPGAIQTNPTDPSTVDVTPFEHLRKENVRVRVGYSRTTGEVIELLSKQELQALYDQLN